MERDPLPDVSLVNEKYHTEQAAAIINWLQLMMKAFTQSPPNKWYKKMYLVWSLHLTVVAKAKGASLGPISPTEKMYIAVNTQAHTHKPQMIRKITGINRTDGVLYIN